MSVQFCPLPTAFLSTHTGGFEGFTFFDFTPHLEAYLAHWKKLGLRFDCVYSGFLGSVEQIGYVRKLIKDFDSGISVIDPVMGDNGILISIYDDQMCRSMRELVSIADVATPNITEACLLTERDFTGHEIDETTSRSLCEGILALGTKSVVLTGVVRENRLYNCIMDKDGYRELDIDELPYHQHGTGDVFASVVVAGLMRGYSLTQSVDSAARFVYDCMEYGHDLPDIFERGVAFEPLACHLGSGLYVRR